MAEDHKWLKITWPPHPLKYQRQFSVYRKLPLSVLGWSRFFVFFRLSFLYVNLQLMGKLLYILLHRPEFSLRKLWLFLLKTFVHHTSYGCMDWFTNAKQANIRRETYTSQLMKGGHFTMNLPLFISSANFLLMKSLLLVLFRGLCSLLGLTAQQKIHW